MGRKIDWWQSQIPKIPPHHGIMGKNGGLNIGYFRFQIMGHVNRHSRLRCLSSCGTTDRQVLISTVKLLQNQKLVFSIHWAAKFA